MVFVSQLPVQEWWQTQSDYYYVSSVCCGEKHKRLPRPDALADIFGTDGYLENPTLWVCHPLVHGSGCVEGIAKHSRRARCSNGHGWLHLIASEGLSLYGGL